MAKKIHILHLEDNPADADIVAYELKKSGIGFELLWVQNKTDFQKGLLEFHPDIVLSDHSLPGFTSIHALKMVKEVCLDIPFILITAAMSDEFAINLMKEGVFDYLLKDRIKRLPVSIVNALEKWEIEKEKQKYYQEVIRSEHIFRAMIEKNEDIITLLLPTGKRLYVSPAITKILGFTPDEYLNSTYQESIHPDDLPEFKRQVSSILTAPGKSAFGKIRSRHKDGTYRWCEGTITNMMKDPDIGAIISNFRDITQRKEAEEKLRTSEEKFKSIFENSPVGISITSIEGGVRSNKALCRLLGYSDEELHAMNWNTITHPDDIRKSTEVIQLLRQHKKSSISLEKKYIHKRGHIVFVEMNISLQFDTEDNPLYFIALINDITKRKKAEEKVRNSEANLMAIIENTDAGIYSIDLNLRYLSFNSVLTNALRLDYRLNIKTGDKVSDFLDKLNPTEANEWKQIYSDALKGNRRQFVKESKKNNMQSFTSFSINPIRKNKKIIGLSCFARDITQEKLSENKLINSEIQIRTFANSLNKMLEDERAHIAREIHDEMGQKLVGIKMGISSLAYKNGQEERIKPLLSEVDNTIQTLRKIATALRPGILDSLGLIPSLRWLIGEFGKKTGLKCKIEINAQERKYEKDISTCYFRICQEALTNISKHARASEVFVLMEQVGDILILNISDNGKGITNEKLDNPFSLGLLGMRERANIIGADLQITSNKNEGTHIKLSVKIKTV